MDIVRCEEGLKRLKQENKEFVKLFERGTLEVELYKPNLVDKQQPHEKDEVYIVFSGNGKFFNNGEVADVKQGDFLFVAAGVEHRFFDFSEDFSTWGFFYGPKGGE